jgi:hypothetical protein
VAQKVPMWPMGPGRPRWAHVAPKDPFGPMWAMGPLKPILAHVAHGPMRALLAYVAYGPMSAHIDGVNTCIRIHVVVVIQKSYGLYLTMVNNVICEVYAC